MVTTNKNIPLLLILFLVLFGYSHSYADEETRWEEWPQVKGASAKGENARFNVYYDPQIPRHYIIYPDCWIIRYDEKEIVHAGCGSWTKQIKGKLFCDSSWRSGNGKVTGVVWDDPKRARSTFSHAFSLIFRQPRFKGASVSFWDGEQWIHVTGLPETKN